MIYLKLGGQLGHAVLVLAVFIIAEGKLLQLQTNWISYKELLRFQKIWKFNPTLKNKMLCFLFYFTVTFKYCLFLFDKCSDLNVFFK